MVMDDPWGSVAQNMAGGLGGGSSLEFMYIA